MISNIVRTCHAFLEKINYWQIVSIGEPHLKMEYLYREIEWKTRINFQIEKLIAHVNLISGSMISQKRFRCVDSTTGRQDVVNSLVHTTVLLY